MLNRYRQGAKKKERKSGSDPPWWLRAASYSLEKWNRGWIVTFAEILAWWGHKHRKSHETKRETVGVFLPNVSLAPWGWGGIQFLLVFFSRKDTLLCMRKTLIIISHVTASAWYFSHWMGIKQWARPFNFVFRFLEQKVLIAYSLLPSALCRCQESASVHAGPCLWNRKRAWNCYFMLCFTQWCCHGPLQ